MPERHLLDVLHNVHYWIPYTRHFGPPSGSDAKLRNPVARYLITIFGYGCNLGLAQTARHARSLATTRVIGRLNAQHVTIDNLDAGIRDIINEYARFRLPFLWGSGEAAIADGTHYELYENNCWASAISVMGGMVESLTITSPILTSLSSVISSLAGFGKPFTFLMVYWRIIPFCSLIRFMPIRRGNLKLFLAWPIC